MVPPERLIGLSRRRRRHTPKPETPVGYMWDKGKLKKIVDVQRHFLLQMMWYDSQPQYIRQLIQEHGLGGLKTAKQQLRSDMVHIPSRPDATLHVGVDTGGPSYTGIVWRST